MSEQRPANTVIAYDLITIQSRLHEIRHEFENLGSLAKWLPELKEWQSNLRHNLSMADSELHSMLRGLGFSEEVLVAMTEEVLSVVIEDEAMSE